MLSPINQQVEQLVFKPAITQIHPYILKINDIEWENAGVYYAASSMSAMHQIGEIIDRVYFGNSDNHLFIRLQLKKYLDNSEKIILNFDNYSINSLEILNNSFKITEKNKIVAVSFIDDSVLISIKDLNMFKNIMLSVTAISKDTEIKYPTNGKIEINFINGVK